VTTSRPAAPRVTYTVLPRAAARCHAAQTNTKILELPGHSSSFRVPRAVQVDLTLCGDIRAISGPLGRCDTTTTFGRTLRCPGAHAGCHARKGMRGTERSASFASLAWYGCHVEMAKHVVIGWGASMLWLAGACGSSNGAQSTLGAAGAAGSSNVANAGAAVGPIIGQSDARKAVCGDGWVAIGEQCDDGNAIPGDGCPSDCIEPEVGFDCPQIGEPCHSICGDGLLRSTECCDDGNATNGDGCSSVCLTEPGWHCSGSTCTRIVVADAGLEADGGAGSCGDGVNSGTEECDDGTSNSDTLRCGCSTDCRTIRCGDGLVNGAEQCDLGPNNTAEYGDGVGCTPSCTPPHYCGDGIFDPGFEDCDFMDPSHPSDIRGSGLLCTNRCTFFSS
jgi:cysteine-rich repeat protein